MIGLNRKSLTIPIMGTFVIVALVMMVAGYYINITELNAALDEREFAKLQGIVRFTNSRIEYMNKNLVLTSELLRGNKTIKDAFGHREQMQSNDSLGGLAVLHRKLKYDLFILADSDGLVFDGYGLKDHMNYGDDLSNLWGVEDALDGHYMISVTRVKKEWAALSMSPVYIEGQIVGIVIVGNLINDVFANRLSLETGSEISLATPHGIIASSLQNLDERVFDFSLIKSIFKEDMKDILVHKHPHGNYSLYSMLRVVDETFCLVVQVDSSDVILLLDKKRIDLIKYSIVAFIFMMLLSPIFYAYIISPLKYLRERIYSLIALYAEDIDPEKKTGNEIRSLVHAFDVLVSTLDDHIEEESLAKEQLKQSNINLRKLSEHMDSVREEERKVIARRVHDELGQRLLALKMSLAYINRNTPDINDDIRLRVSALLGEIDKTVAIVQTITSQLRPSILDDLGLVAAIKWKTEEVFENTSIACAINSELEAIEINHTIELTLFRVFTESVVNILHHAGAREVRIDLNQAGNVLSMIIQDNGRGIREDKLMSPDSFGILGMLERMEAIGGTLEIKRGEQGGTIVTASVQIV